MKECMNCKHMNKEKDVFCRNCGFVIKNDKHYVILNIVTILAFILLVFEIILLVVSFYVK